MQFRLENINQQIWRKRNRSHGQYFRDSNQIPPSKKRIHISAQDLLYLKHAKTFTFLLCLSFINYRFTSAFSPFKLVDSYFRDFCFHIRRSAFRFYLWTLKICTFILQTITASLENGGDQSFVWVSPPLPPFFQRRQFETLLQQIQSLAWDNNLTLVNSLPQSPHVKNYFNNPATAALLSPLKFRSLFRVLFKSSFKKLRGGYFFKKGAHIPLFVDV